MPPNKPADAEREDAQRYCRTLIGEIGIEQAAARIGVSVGSLLRIVGGLDVRRGTMSLLHAHRTEARK